MRTISLTCWVLDSSAIGSQYRLGIQSTFSDSRVHSFHGRKSPDISLFKKERIIANPRYGRVSEEIGGRALANDDSMRFGTATRARTSVEVEAEEGLRASRGRRENLQKLSALTSSEWPSSSVNVSGANADPRTVDGACEGKFHMCSLLSRPWLFVRKTTNE
jgi:hypothetical protein